MSRITDIYLIDTAAQEAIAIHSKVSIAEIPAIIGEGFMKLDEYIKSIGIVASDTPFLQIIGTDPNSIEITAGMTVPATVHGNGEIEDFLIPAGKKIFCYWQGDNSDMSSLYEEMKSYANEIGYEIQEGFFEYYLNGPEYGTNKLLTKVVMLLLPLFLA